MLQHFLNGPVVDPKPSNEAYELAWRPLGAKQLTLAAEAPKREKKSRKPAR